MSWLDFKCHVYYFWMTYCRAHAGSERLHRITNKKPLKRKMEALRKCFFLLIMANLWFLIRFHFVWVVFSSLVIYACALIVEFSYLWRIRNYSFETFPASFKIPPHIFCRTNNCSTIWWLVGNSLNILSIPLNSIANKCSSAFRLNTFSCI